MILHFGLFIIVIVIVVSLIITIMLIVELVGVGVSQRIPFYNV